ncbi:MAG: EamA family transporter [Acidobacteriaceae bacterium]|nr:EamA family transporter [Acidobacteriaceae bacterium]
MHSSPHYPLWFRDWLCIAGVAALAIAGECLIAAAMRTLGDLDDIRAVSGLPGAIKAVLSSPLFVIGALCMALNFFALLFTLSIVNLSLAAPATASLTYIGNAIAAKLFLGENVDRRRWLATMFVAMGVALISR